MGLCRVMKEILILIMWKERNEGKLKEENKVKIEKKKEKRKVERI